MARCVWIGNTASSSLGLALSLYRNQPGQSLAAKASCPGSLVGAIRSFFDLSPNSNNCTHQYLATLSRFDQLTEMDNSNLDLPVESFIISRYSRSFRSAVNDNDRSAIFVFPCFQLRPQYNCPFTAKTGAAHKINNATVRILIISRLYPGMARRPQSDWPPISGFADPQHQRRSGYGSGNRCWPSIRQIGRSAGARPPPRNDFYKQPTSTRLT